MDINNQQHNQEFRKSYRQKEISTRYSGIAHFCFTMSFALSVLVWAAWNVNAASWLEWLTVPLTFLYANIVEYFAHKGPMHRPFKGINVIYRRHATQHHVFFTHQFMQFDSTKDFKAVLFPPYLILFFLVVFAVPVGLLINWLFGANVSYLFIATAFAYFAMYEILHTTYHLSDDAWIYRFAFFRKLRKLHQNHHRPDLMSRCNFNITFPICDWLFGTYYIDDSEQTPVSSHLTQ